MCPYIGDQCVSVHRGGGGGAVPLWDRYHVVSALWPSCAPVQTPPVMLWREVCQTLRRALHRTTSPSRPTEAPEHPSAHGIAWLRADPRRWWSAAAVVPRAPTHHDAEDFHTGLTCNSQRTACGSATEVPRQFTDVVLSSRLSHVHRERLAAEMPLKEWQHRGSSRMCT